MTLSKRNNLILLSLFVGALIVRLAYFWFVGVTPASDSFVFDNVARRWAETRFASFSDGKALFQEFLNLRVAYAFVGAIIYLLFGVGNHAAVVIFQIVLDSAIAAGIFFVFAR